MHHDSCPSMRERQPRRDVYTVDLKQSSVVFEFMYRGYTIHCQRAATSHAVISVVGEDNLVMKSQLDNVEHALQWCDDALKQAVHFNEIRSKDKIHSPFERGRFAPSVRLEKIPISELVFNTLMQNTPYIDEDATDNLLIIDKWGNTCFIGLHREYEVYYMVKIYDIQED